MIHEVVKAALEDLANFCGFENLDNITRIEVDTLRVKVTVISRDINGRPLTSADEYVTQSIERRWR
jgi:hypothetical protein